MSHKTLSTLALALLASLLAPHAAAIDKPMAAQVQARYRAERAVCLNGQSTQSLQTCLREAEAARAQALKGDLDDGAVDYARNAGQRCERLTPPQRPACLQRVQGGARTATEGISRD